MANKDITLEREEYIRGVKKKLSEALVKSKLTNAALLTQLEDTYGFGLNRGTLSKLFDENDTTSLDYACLVTVCHFFGFDFNKILEPEVKPGFPPRYRDIAGEEYGLPDEERGINRTGAREIDTGKAFIESLRDAQDQFLILNDEGYEGVFTGYYLPESQRKPAPRKFTLEMKKQDNGTMKARLEQKIRFMNPKTKKMETKSEVFVGVPVYVKAYRSVMILMTSDKNTGECWLLAFAYQKYDTEVGLVYRHGLMLTGESIKGAALSAETFLLFNTPVKKDKQKFLTGLLKAPNWRYTVSVDEAKELAEKDPDVKEFLEKFDKILEMNRQDVYVIHEDDILTANAVKMEKYDRVKGLLMLKAISTVAGVYHFRAKHRYTGFAVNYLAEAMLDEPGDDEEEPAEEET